jgi:glycyl-tRNA synthetase beta chain
LSKLCSYTAAILLPDLEKELKQAGLLCKADLVSEMVGEFDNLQGIMGGIYAKKENLNKVVAEAIYEHYLPQGHEFPVPTTTAGAILSACDKLDNLVGCFGQNMIPTGAQDPFALRRQALGIVRIILEHGFKISLEDLIFKDFSLYQDVNWKLTKADLLDKLLEFFNHRLKAYFTAQGFETLNIDAVLGAGFTDLFNCFQRLKAMQEFSFKEDFEQMVLTFKRADNIIKKQSQNVNQTLNGEYDRQKLVEPQEMALSEVLDKLKPRWDKLWQKEEFSTLFDLLHELKPVVDDFFDNVMVICENIELRINRLNLLQSLVGRLSALADFSALQI